MVKRSAEEKSVARWKHDHNKKFELNPVAQ